ncbi:MAG: YfhO family protein, partial [Ruminococcus sp.]|nr:YfhO family protein [Ruminococcus sp.]
YEARTAETLKNVELGKRSITGDITVTGDKLLSVCCLHNDGWKVYVDGEQAELCSVNDLFLGVKLGEGSHHVEFRYFTPWLKEGALLSAAGVILLIAADILLKKKTAGRDDKEETKA